MSEPADTLRAKYGTTIRMRTERPGMTLPISPYLLPYLKTADQLPDQLPDSPEAVVQDLQARIRKLVELVAARDAQIEKLEGWVLADAQAVIAKTEPAKA